MGIQRGFAFPNAIKANKSRIITYACGQCVGICKLILDDRNDRDKRVAIIEYNE